ncbi:MAG: RDD family protein [Alphaproteobacteria bacterium]|nr:RDD family protein [Alphaproteobacteria bacterium]
MAQRQTIIPPSGVFYPVTYGSVIARFFAMILDDLFIAFIMVLALLPLYILTILGALVWGPFFAWLGIAVIPTAGFFYVFLQWIYFAMFESTSRGATPGKMIFGLRVAGYDGKRISFGQATLRYFCKYISAFPMMLGFVMAFFMPRKQALHDLLAATLVVRGRS